MWLFLKALDCKIIEIWALYLKVHEFNGQFKNMLTSCNQMISMCM
jgi:hypothetical protein